MNVRCGSARNARASIAIDVLSARLIAPARMGREMREYTRSLSRRPAFDSSVPRICTALYTSRASSRRMGMKCSAVITMKAIS